MRNFLQRVLYKFSIWMNGRYGTDELNIALIVISAACGILSCFPFLWRLPAIGTLALIFACFRMFSKDIAKRQRELDKYYQIKRKFTSFFSLRKKMYEERKTHRYFKCKNCKTYLRVPKRNNKIEVTCPKCGQKTIR